jgi:hypothetical protein
MALIAVRAGGPWAFKQRVIADWIAHAEESVLSEDEQMALGALHDQDWRWLRDNGWLD